MTWALFEECCGSFALTLHLLGAKRAILPYQGSKWGVRKQLAEVLKSRGFEGPPSQVYLTDIGPWGRVGSVVLVREWRHQLIQQLEGLAAEDPHEVYERLHLHTVSADPITYAAEFLFLQRLAFSGKAVTTGFGGRWIAPGFNKTSAYGVEATERFGRVKPMIPSLIQTLVNYDTLRMPQRIASIQAAAGPPDTYPVEGSAVYIDPDYKGTTPYADQLRHEVPQLAQAWHSRGAFVMVSEADPIEELVAAGWAALRIASGGRNGASPFRRKGEEWVTISPARSP